MSSSTSPKMETDAAATSTAITSTTHGTTGPTGASSSMVDGVLQIELPRGEVGKLDRALVPLKGSPPEERAFWWTFAHKSGDRRRIGPLTLQFKSSEPDNISCDQKAQDGIMAALWSTLEGYLTQAGCEIPEDLPRISFDELQKTQEPSFSLIELAFDSVTAFKSVYKKLKQIDLAGQGSQKRTYVLHRKTNELPSNVFTFDCLNLPVLETIDAKKLFSAMTAMTRKLGPLLGIAEMVVHSADREFGSGTIRGYIELERRWMKVPLKKVVAQLPTSFLWYGKSHKLLYPGLKLRAEFESSADYPLASDHEEESEASAMSSDEGSEASGSSASSNSDEDDGQARKKRKREGK